MEGGRAKTPWFLGGCLAALATALGPAAAQEGPVDDQSVQRGQTVLERPRPDYDPKGQPVGSFRLYPSLTVSEVYDDNIFRTEDAQGGEEADFITVVSPLLELQSDWNNHELNFEAGADLGFYASNSSENYEDYWAGTAGRLDITRDSNIFGGVSYSRFHEDRGSPDDVNGAEPTEYDAFFPRLGYFHRFNRVSVQTEAEFLRLDYHDVSRGGAGEINNDDRDRNHVEGSVRLGYEIQEEYEAFVRGSYNVVRYDDRLDDLGFDRDSNGFEAVAGVSVDFTGLLFGDFFAGYARQEPINDPVLETVSGPTFGADFTWNPTGLTTVRAGVTRNIEETTQGGASGFFATAYSVSVDHELLRNLILSASGQFRQDDYFGNAREDQTYGAGAGARYLMNRYVHLGLEYDYSQRESSVIGQNFNDNRFMFSIRGQF